MKDFKHFGLLICACLVGVLVGVLATIKMPNLSASEIKTHEHELIAHDSHEATCTTDGNRAYWECPQCNLYFSDAYGVYTISDFTNWVTIKALKHATNENYHTHAQQPSCATTGNYDYYICMNGCGGYFADENCQHEIKDKSKINRAKTNHDLAKVKYVPAKIATCTEAGNIEHYLCTTCNHTFEDKYCTIELNNVIEIKKHETDQTHFTDYTPATCLQNGKKAHYDCVNCGQHFEDIDCMKIIDNIIIPQKQHLSYKSHFSAYKAPTCEEAGQQAYFICQNGCGQKFAEDNCKTLLTDADIHIDALGHDYILEKVDANQIAEYKIDELDKYYHGRIEYQSVCKHEGCGKLKNTIQLSGFGKIDTTNNTHNNGSVVESSIEEGINANGKTEVYDLYILDWASSRKFTDNQEEYTKILIKTPDTYNINSNYFDNGATVTDMQNIVHNYSLNLIIRADQVAKNPNLLWKFDWDGDGIYEQIIKVQVINY